ncbi:NAD(P)-dependent oxidoreductase [Herbiconiux sp. CPCC 203407]|uniref:NAD(P)-dependent oxidoreductase n=1 Tax=Herbiconiux oxytropis TaxID=2970915 RepID=A0AA41XFY3_9MICO|nr:NAD(P)-dependent oxidoreductase [Herbiconiux oxytropis]MCS5723703.1 NAD(P)-dependent oxidoreductase [Herbiconiux oxytropis]MCS5725474.1 NAD(P)-dependent oxidoreductase [Herbiconiux oxytropis]
MRIGVLGLGRMGLPIARALAERSTVVAFDPRGERRRALVRAVDDTGDSARLELADGVPEASEGADALVTVLPGPGEFEASADDVIGALPAGALWVDLTSNDPRVLAATEGRARSAGIALVSAPMTGGPAAAETATLGFTVSGDPAAIDRAHPLLEALCGGVGGGVGGVGRITVAGDRIGDACTVKLLANLLWFGQVAAVTEAMLLGASLGLEPARLHRMLADGPGASTMLSRDYPAVLRGDWMPAFGLDRVVEELDTLSSLAAETGVPFELSEQVAELHRQALERFGPADGELLVARLLEERAGTPLREPRIEVNPAETETT